MGRSGGGGGSHSSGGFSGGSRSSGGFSSSSRSYSSSHSSSYSGGHHYYHYGGYGRNYGGGYYSSPSLLGPGATIVLILAFITLIAVTTIGTLTITDSPTRSTIVREPLPLSASQETEYFKDPLGWFSNAGQVRAGMKEFAKETGVRPYLYITDGSEGTTVSELNASSQRIYDEICSDEAHFVLLFYDDGYGNYNCGYTIGVQAKNVMDEEAIAIFADYLDRYYHSDLTDEEVFAQTYSKTAERMMTVTQSPMVSIAKLLIPGLVVVFLVWIVSHTIIKKKALAAKEAEATAKILNTPIETLGSSGLDDLEEKYSNK